MSEPSAAASDYLEEIAGVGTHDSSGSFTLSLQAAIEKLSAFQLPRESAWVLKVVQCAVAWGAGEIAVKQGSSVTSFSFANSGTFDLDALQAALLSATPTGPAHIVHLAVALRGVGFGQRRSFRLSIRTGGQRQTLIWDGKDFHQELESVSSLAVSTVDLKVDFADDQKGRLLGLLAPAARAASDESTELTLKAAVCPIALTLDGRRIDVLGTPLPSQSALESAKLSLAWSPPAGAEGRSLRLPAGVELDQPWFRMGNRLTDRRIFLLDGNKKQRESEFLLRLSYHYSYTFVDKAYVLTAPVEKSSWLHWVVDGVICDSEAISKQRNQIKMDLYLSGSGLPTDISGLTLKLGGTDDIQRRNRAVDFAMASIDRVQGELAKHQHGYLKIGAVVGSGAALLTVLGGPVAWIACFLFGIILAPAIGMGGIELTRASNFAKLLLQDCQVRLSTLKHMLRKKGRKTFRKLPRT